MTVLSESLTQNAQGAGLGAGLQAVVGQLSAEQLFTFTLYKRLLLPADGFVFWAPASTVTPPIVGAEFTFQLNGSLHVVQQINQETDANYVRQDVKFTTKQQVTQFEEVESGLLYVMTLPNGSLLAFNGQTGRFDQAGIWHYVGKALLPFEATQFIASSSDIPADNVVSNSMPFWLAMSTDSLPVFPSYLVPQNTIPPYVSAEINGTEAVGAAPLLGPESSQTQLAMETVRFTFYGVRNNGVLDFQRALLENSMNGIETGDEPYGVMNSPVPVDVDRPQSEFGIKAQEKTMDLTLNYYQSRARETARQLILQAFITLTPE